MSDLSDLLLDIVVKFLPVLLVIIIALVIACGIFIIYEEICFSYAPSYRIECELLADSYSPSTIKTRVAPIVSANGQISTAAYRTGNLEKHITVWNCGKFGRLTCDKKEVFQFAKNRSILIIRSNEYDTRIVGIVRD